MADILTDLAALRQQVEQAKEKKIRAQAKVDQAQAAETEALDKLKEMGYESPDEALKAAKAVQSSVADMIATIKKKLEETQ